MTPKLNWIWDGEKFYLKVPIQMWKGDRGRGSYNISIFHRPSYCDRGDWVILVDGFNDLDFADGFPRYFFGSVNDVLCQVETWLNRREAYRNIYDTNVSKNGRSEIQQLPVLCSTEVERSAGIVSEWRVSEPR